jgi:hypothetical protein
MRAAALTLVVFVLVASTAKADWKKDYFGATPVGSWATYSTKSSVGDPSITTSTRLDDRTGRVRLEDRTSYPGREYPPSAQRFEMAPDFKIQRDLLDFARSLSSASSSTNGGAFQAMPASTIRMMKEMATSLGTIAVFVNTETIDGKACDHYTYSAPSQAPGQVESGDLWVSDAVPFGLVRRTTQTKDQSGKVVWSMEQSLTDFGLTPKAATPPARRPR